MPQIVSLVWNVGFFSSPQCCILYVMTRPTLVQHFLTAIQTPLSSVGSSRSPRFRSDWEILQVRAQHTYDYTLSSLNHSQSTSTKSFSSSASFIFPHWDTHTHTSSGISIQLPPSLLIAFWNHKPYLDCVIKSLSFISLLSQEQAQKVAASGNWFTPGLKWKADQRPSSSCVAGQRLNFQVESAISNSVMHSWLHSHFFFLPIKHTRFGVYFRILCLT